MNSADSLAHRARADARPGGPSIVIDGRMIFQDQCHGIARVTIEMVRRFPADTGVPVRMLLPSRESARFSLEELPPWVEMLPCDAPIGAPHRFREVSRILRSADAAVLFAPYHSLAPLHTPCPVVVGVHDCILESDIRLTGGRAKQLLYEANTARVLRTAAAVVVPSESTAASLPAYYASVPPVTVCRNGVDLATFRREAQTAAALNPSSAALALPSSYILHVGSRRGHKNQSVLVRALALMDPRVSLVLVGHPDPRVHDPVDELIHQLGVADRVVLLDSLSDDQLREVYRNAAVFAFPSSVEGFGLPPLEAMALGVPVVASAVPAVAEVCGQAALLVSPYDPRAWADAMGQVMSRAEVAAEMIAAGARVASASSWDAGAEALFGVLAAFVPVRQAAKVHSWTETST